MSSALEQKTHKLFFKIQIWVSTQKTTKASHFSSWLIDQIQEAA